MKKSILKELILQVLHEQEEQIKLTPFNSFQEDIEYASTISSFMKYLFQAYNKANAKNSKRLEDAFPELFVEKSVVKK